MISEQVEAYAWMLWCCSNFSCKRKLDGVHAIFGDGLVTCDSLLTSLGIQDSCSLLDDVHHLLSPECGTWYKHFRASRWNNCGELLRVLVFESYSSERYETIRSKILTLMESQSEPQSLYDYFNNTIHVARKRFTRYSVHATPCNEERLGSSIAEANHASYVARIGGGSWDDPATQVKDCIICMQELSNERARARDQYWRQSAANSHTEARSYRVRGPAIPARNRLTWPSPKRLCKVSFLSETRPREPRDPRKRIYEVHGVLRLFCRESVQVSHNKIQ